MLADRTQRPHRALLDRTQQLALHRQRQVADLIEEQCAALSGLKKPGSILGCTGERALSVAEELRFEQLLRDRTAVDRDEGLVSARADLVQRARNQLLAGARLAQHHHRRHAARHPLDQGSHLLHRRCSTSQTLHRRTLAGDLAHHRCRTGQAQRPPGLRLGSCRRQTGIATYRSGDHVAELPQVHRLGEVVESAGLERLHRVLGRTVGCDHDRFFTAPCCLDPAQQVEPAAVGQSHVGDHGVVAAFAQALPGLL